MSGPVASAVLLGISQPPNLGKFLLPSHPPSFVMPASLRPCLSRCLSPYRYPKEPHSANTNNNPTERGATNKRHHPGGTPIWC